MQAVCKDDYRVTICNELLDEYEYECEGKETANEVAKLIEKSIVKSGEYLKLKIPLAGEGKVGLNWKETH